MWYITYALFVGLFFYAKNASKLPIMSIIHYMYSIDKLGAGGAHNES